MKHFYGKRASLSHEPGIHVCTILLVVKWRWKLMNSSGSYTHVRDCKLLSRDSFSHTQASNARFLSMWLTNEGKSGTD